MVDKKKTLVILAFDQTKTPKKKLKKIQKEILSYLSCQNFKEFFLLKEKEQGSFVRFTEKQKKTFHPIEEISQHNFEHYLYIVCDDKFFCGDYNFFCQNAKSSMNVALSYQLGKALSGSVVEKLPFATEKVLFFSKEALSSLENQKKVPQLLLGSSVPFENGKSLYALKCMREHRAPCLFLDRDGIIIKDKKYLSKPEEIEFVDGIFDLVRWAKNKKWYVIVVTNQSGIGRGLYTEEDYQRCQSLVEAKFREENIPLSKAYFSPYHEKSEDKKILEEIYTRKPFPGMLLKAAKDFPIDFANSIMVGDKKSDEFIETPLTTYFVKGDYPVEEGKRTFSSVKELLIHLEAVENRLTLPVEKDLTSHPVV